MSQSSSYSSTLMLLQQRATSENTWFSTSNSQFPAAGALSLGHKHISSIAHSLHNGICCYLCHWWYKFSV